MYQEPLKTEYTHLVISDGKENVTVLQIIVKETGDDSGMAEYCEDCLQSLGEEAAKAIPAGLKEIFREFKTGDY